MRERASNFKATAYGEPGDLVDDDILVSQGWVRNWLFGKKRSGGGSTCERAMVAALNTPQEKIEQELGSGARLVEIKVSSDGIYRHSSAVYTNDKGELWMSGHSRFLDRPVIERISPEDARAMYGSAGHETGYEVRQGKASSIRDALKLY